MEERDTERAYMSTIALIFFFLRGEKKKRKDKRGKGTNGKGAWKKSGFETPAIQNAKENKNEFKTQTD